MAPKNLRKSSMLNRIWLTLQFSAGAAVRGMCLPLGGAAVYRCGRSFLSTCGFSR